MEYYWNVPSHNNGIYQTPIVMTMGYISNISRCQEDGIYLTPVTQFHLILSVKVVYIYIYIYIYAYIYMCNIVTLIKNMY